MCGRFTLASEGAVVAEFFELPSVPDLTPRFNIAPTQTVPAVWIKAGDQQRRLGEFRWGLIPSWADDPAIGSRMINARGETVADKPSFRSAFGRRRCLVVADGFYEWQKVENRKQPFHIHLQDRQPFGFAGLWERWKGRDGVSIDSCTIITTESNELMKPLHHRMPVILHPDDFATWLDPQMHNSATLQALLRPFPSDKMTAYPVSTRVNKASTDNPACIEPTE